ncbi:MAG TPA: hypothetical protein VNE00_19705 [Paraburkholderia sp.]|jgi:hypothetical protein|nr:hypothetical protein [Paraburkholderia sp.]
MRTVLAIAALLGAQACLCPLPAAAAAKGASRSRAIDPRAFMHGIDAVPDGRGDINVFFSSSGLPPRGPGRDRNWTHDVYVAHWSAQQANLDKPRVFISRGEAQEPVSVAANDSGRVMVTFEDGWNTPDEVSQRYGVYTSDLQGVLPYPNDVRSGGHSGHVAAVGARFVVFYADDWVDGGGQDNLGTGNGVYLKTYDANGTQLQAVNVAPRVREWWPLIAGSPTRALLVWQQYVSGATYARLKTAVFNPQDGSLSDARVLAPRLRYYTYAVTYVPAVERFLLVATGDDGKGFAQLLDASGATTATLACMPATVREAGIAVSGERAFLPSRDGRLMALKLGAASVELAGSLPSPIKWGEVGGIGLVRSPNSLHWVALTQQGLKETDFDLAALRPASAADRCAR